MNAFRITALMAFAIMLAPRAAAQEILSMPQENAPRAGAASEPESASPFLPSQNPLRGSVATGQATAEVLSLTLFDAIERGLRQNLAQLFGNDAVLSAQGDVWQRRSVLLPNISANASEHAAQVNLAAQGFQKIAGRFPGFPIIVGPFGYLDVRGVVTQSVLDVNALANARSAERNVAAAKSSYQDTREMVVLVVGATYFQTIAASARVDSAEAELKTAQALYTLALDMRNVGSVAGIDVLRAQVEVQTRQQQLIASRNDLSKQKIELARTIGLPLGQSFTLADNPPYEPVAAVTVEDALQRAYASRADLQAALARVKAAEYTRRAATAEHLPSANAYADYGVIGPTPSALHGSFSAFVALHIPIFAGNRAHGDALVAEAALQRSRQQLENLRGQIEQDVRTAILDQQSSSDQVNVARSNIDLAQQTLTQARDRFSAGVTNNIEVVQAQQAVANATDSYISSLFAYNLARVELARATGSAERDIRQYWKGQ